MCFDADALPPLPPLHGSALDARDLVLTAADGTRVAAYAARAEQPSGAGVVICPDVRGLFHFYEELALRFAESGVDAVAFDYFSRTAGTGSRDGEFDYATHVPLTRIETLNQDIGAATAHLRSPDGGSVDRLFTLGFCMGGRISFLQAARPDLHLAGVVGFYGVPQASPHSSLPAPVEQAGQFSCPVLGLFGGADRAIPAEAREAFDRALAAAGVEHTFVVYEGAPHSFFDRKATEFADASADAWRQALGFMGVAS